MNIDDLDDLNENDFCDACGAFWMDCDCESEGWTMDEEEALIADGMCPECGGALDECPHGADWFADDDDDFVD